MYFRRVVYLLCIHLATLALPTHAADFELAKLADGVYAAVRSEPPGLTFVSNSVFIINDDDVVVVDTGVGPATARAAIAALKALTAKPVRYVINTHWHDDHMLGNDAYREAYPGVEFIGHANAAAELMSTGAANRRQLLEQGPAFAAQIRDAMAKNENLAGKPISGEERLTYASDLAWAERYFLEAPRFNVIAPTLTFAGELTLVRDGRVITVRHLGRAHTAADIIVHLPRENIVIAGDLVVWPIPLFGSTSFPVDYIATLEALLAIKPALLVPGHGPVMRDDGYVRQMLAILKSIESQTRSAVARGETAEQARKSVNLDEHRKLLAGDSAMRRLLFDSYVANPGVSRAYLQLSGKL
ncbi:MAG: MBL fold metallo-hydrolase [Betaproteobacteria bacterium]